MASDALPVPRDLRPLLHARADVDWGAIAWDAVRRRAAALERVEGLARRSALGPRDARALALALREEEHAPGP